MINRISFNVPQAFVQPALTAVAENSIAASFAKSSYSLQSLNSIAATQQNIIWLIAVGLAMWACSEDGPPSRNTPIANDPDNDNIPDDKDKCPDGGALNMSGCALEDPALDQSTIDSDGDGIPDDRDECLHDAHPSLDPQANGCSPLDIVDELPDGGLPPSIPDPRPQSSWQLLPGESRILQREENPICPHLANNGRLAMLGWQEGNHFYVGLVSDVPLVVAGMEDVGEVASDAVTTCQLTRALAINSNGQTAVLLPELVDENWVKLQLQLKNANGSSTVPQEIATLPFPHLGEAQRDTFASLAALSNNNFVVVWTDRDQVLARIVNPDGIVIHEEPLQVRRALDVLQMSNPDVLASADGFKVIWQEGNAPYGDAGFASFNMNGEKVGEDQLLNPGETPVRWPTLANSGNAAAWISASGGSVQNISEAGAEQLFSFTPQSEEVGDLAALYSPQLMYDAQDRATLAWIEQYRDASSKLRLYSHSDASMLPADTASVGTQVSNIPTDSKIALTQQDDTVLLAYPVSQPASSMMLRSFQWTTTPGGRESAAQP